MLHNIVIKQRKVYLYNNRFVQGGINADEINLTVDPEWEICDTILVTFKNDNVEDTVTYLITPGTPLLIPSSVLSESGLLYFSFTGYVGEEQRLTTSSVWHPGDVGTESLFYEIRIAPDGIIVWSQPFGEYNAPDKGDLRHYPDSNSPIYRSLIDNNAYSPEAYPAGWELYEA